MSITNSMLHLTHAYIILKAHLYYFFFTKRCYFFLYILVYRFTLNIKISFCKYIWLRQKTLHGRRKKRICETSKICSHLFFYIEQYTKHINVLFVYASELVTNDKHVKPFPPNVFLFAGFRFLCVRCFMSRSPSPPPPDQPPTHPSHTCVQQRYRAQFSRFASITAKE